MEEDIMAPAVPLQHPEDGLVLVVESGDLGEVHTMTKMPSEEALVAALRGHLCWVCGASADTHDANLDHLMAHLQAAPAVPSTPPHTAQSEDQVLEHVAVQDHVLESEVLASEVLKDEVLDDEVLDDEVLESEVLKDEDLDNEVLDNEVLHNEVLDREVLHNEVLEREVLHSEVLEREVLHNEVLEREVLHNEVLEREVLQNEVLEREVLHNEVLEREVLESEVLKREVLESEVLESEVLESEVLKREALDSEVLKREVLESEVLESEVLDEKVLASDADLDVTVDASTMDCTLGDETSFVHDPEGSLSDAMDCSTLSDPVPESPTVAALLPDNSPECNPYSVPDHIAADLPESIPVDVPDVIPISTPDVAHLSIPAVPDSATLNDPVVPVALPESPHNVQDLESVEARCQGSFTASPVAALQPMDPDVVLQPAGLAGPFSASPPPPTAFSDSDIHSVLLSAAGNLESASLLVEEARAATTPVPPHQPLPMLQTLQVLDSALEGLAADVAASATPATSPDQQQRPATEVTFFKEPPRYSYAGKSAARQRPSLDLIVSRLFSQRAAIEAAKKSAAKAQQATLLDENSNAQRAVQHDFQALVQEVPEDDVDLDVYAVTAAALEAQHPNSLVCAICLKSFAHRDALLQHVEDEVRVLGRQAKAPSRRVRPRRDSPPRPSPRKRPVRAVTKRAAMEKAAKEAREAREAREAKEARVAKQSRAEPPPTKWPCGFCTESFLKRQELREHVAAEHKDDAERHVPHQCPVCRKRFPRRDHLEQHQLLHSDGRPFQCGRCGLSFRRKDRLLSHVRTHPPRGASSKPAPTSTKPPVAPFQDAVEASNKGPASPAPAAADGPLTCLTCSKAFPIKSRLRRHVRQVHSPNMPHVCLTCGKDCMTRKRLMAHVARHITDRVNTFRCADCGDVLDDKRSLLRHRRSRHGVSVDVDPAVPPAASSTAPPSSASSIASCHHASATVSSTLSSSASSSGTARPTTANKESGTDSKPPQKYVFKIVSKSGSSQTANMAAKLLPTLASDFAAKRNGSKSPSKVVYMVMSKNKPGGSGTVAGTAEKPVSKVLMKIVSKDGPPKKVPCLVPRTPPKLGFKVVSKVVPLDSAALKEELRSSSACLDTLNMPIMNPVPRPKTAWPTPALSVTGVAPLYGGASLSAPHLGPPYLDSPYPTATASAAPTFPSCSSQSAFPGGPSPDVAPPLGTSLLEAPAVDAACSLDAPVLEAAPQADPTPGSQGQGSGPKLVGQFPVATDGRFLCDLCGRRFVTEPLYTLHVQARGKAVKTFECQCCGQRFLDKDVLRAHWKTHM